MTIEVAVIISIISCILGVLGFFRTNRKDEAALENWRGAVAEQLKTINNTLSEVKGMLSITNSKLEDHEKRIIKLENQRGEN